MKKQMHILEGMIILIIIFIAGLLSIEFIYKIRHETMDTNYMWNISLNNLKVKEGSKNAHTSIEDNVLNFDITLENENEFYEATFDIENNGTLDAVLTQVQEQVNNSKNVLTYNIRYLDGDKINEGDILESNTKKTILIRIDYPEQKTKIYDALEIKITLSLEYKALYK